MPLPDSSHRRMSPNSVADYGAALLTWFSMVCLAVCLAASLGGIKVDGIWVTTFSGLLLAGAGTRVVSDLRRPPDPPVPPTNPEMPIGGQPE